MKNAIICHGTGSTPDSFWFPSIKNFLEKIGYQVYVPQFPDADYPDLKKWLPFILERGDFNSETVLIGHSAGAPLTLSILENIKVNIAKAVLVSGYARPKGAEKEPELILQDIYKWSVIKERASDFVFINSDNDPWGCNHEEGLYMWSKLGGTLILRSGEGHMGSDYFHQPYKKFLLLEKILELNKAN